MVELFFRLFPGSIRSPQVVEFLSHRLRHIPGKLLVVWDGLRSHRGRLVWDFVCQQRGRIGLEFLLACAPQLNPVEYLWSHWKQHELPNFCPKNFGELSHYARKALWRMRRRSTRFCPLVLQHFPSSSLSWDRLRGRFCRTKVGGHPYGRR